MKEQETTFLRTVNCLNLSILFTWSFYGDFCFSLIVQWAECLSSGLFGGLDVKETPYVLLFFFFYRFLLRLLKVVNGHNLIMLS